MVSDVIPQGIGAKSLHIEEIAPAANRLSQHNAGESRIRYRQHGKLFDAADDKRHNKRSNNAAIDGQSATTQVEYFL